MISRIEFINSFLITNSFSSTHGKYSCISTLIYTYCKQLLLYTEAQTHIQELDFVHNEIKNYYNYYTFHS